MTTLIAILGTGKGTWAQVSKLLRQADFEKVILITNDFGKENFTPDETRGSKATGVSEQSSNKIQLVVVDFDADLVDLQKNLSEKLKSLLIGTEVALNFVSGAGKEHMVLLSTLLKLGLGIRLVVAGKGSFVEL